MLIKLIADKTVTTNADKVITVEIVTNIFQLIIYSLKKRVDISPNKISLYHQQIL